MRSKTNRRPCPQLQTTIPSRQFYVSWFWCVQHVAWAVTSASLQMLPRTSISIWNYILQSKFYCKNNRCNSLGKQQKIILISYRYIVLFAFFVDFMLWHFGGAGESIGNSVGYRIGGASAVVLTSVSWGCGVFVDVWGESRPGYNIDFCTVGYTLQLFLNSPEESKTNLEENIQGNWSILLGGWLTLRKRLASHSGPTSFAATRSLATIRT